MKGTDDFALERCRCSLKKNVTLYEHVKHFFRPVTIGSPRRLLFIVSAVLSLQLDLTLQDLQSLLGTAVIFYPDFDCGGLQLCQHSSDESVVLAGRYFYGGLLSVAVWIRSPYKHAARRLFQRHHVKELIMTITNHIRRIEYLADQVIVHVDERNYCAAHSALDDIIVRTLLAHEHIDHLQDVLPVELVPAGGN